MTCPVCQGLLWICEAHPDQPWEHDGCGGAGLPCVCNPKGEVLWAEVYAEATKPPDEPIQ